MALEEHLRINQEVCSSFYSNLMKGYRRNEYLQMTEEVTVVINYKDYINSERSTGFISDLCSRDSKMYASAMRYLTSYEIGDSFKELPHVRENNSEVYNWFVSDTVVVMLKLISLTNNIPIDFEITIPTVVIDGQETYRMEFDFGDSKDLAFSKTQSINVVNNLSPIHLKTKIKESEEFRDRFMADYYKAYSNRVDSVVLEEELLEYMLNNNDRKSSILGKIFLYIYISVYKLDFVIDYTEKEVL